jgi:hypothetical protein
MVQPSRGENGCGKICKSVHKKLLTVLAAMFGTGESNFGHETPFSFNDLYLCAC